MKFFKGTVDWFCECDEKQKIDVVYGFANSLIEFVGKIEPCFSYIDSLEIETINSIASDEQLIWVDSKDYVTQKAIEEENTY